MTLRTRRTWRRTLPPGPPAGIGHNQGPPLDAWNAFCWRKAQKAAWKSVPIEVVRRRCRRARELGLSYQDYAAVIMDRGAHLQTLFFDLGGTLVEVENDEVRTDSSGRIRPLPGVVEKLSGLKDCKVFVITNQAGVAEGLITAEQARSFIEQINALCNTVLTDYRVCMEAADSRSRFRKPQPGMVCELLAEHGLLPSAAVMIGDSESDRKCAEAAKLARFIWARDYFGWT